MRRTVVRALEDWVQAGLLTREQAETLRASLGASASDRAIRAFAVIGAVLAGLGVILFVGSNWRVMGPVARIATLLGGYAVVVAGATIADRRKLPFVAEAGWLLVSLIFGANIFLLAQIFNHSLTYWQGPFWWMVGAVMLGWARQSTWQASLAVPLGLLALGWLGGGQGWFFDDQMEFLIDRRGLRPILPLMGLGLISFSLVAQRATNWRFTAGPSLRWGLLLSAIPLVVSTVHIDAARWMFEFEASLQQLFILAGVVILVASALSFGVFRSREGRPLLAGATVFLFITLIRTSGRPWIASESRFFVIYIVTVFALALLVIWVGVRAQNPRLVNVGMVSTGLVILVQYFSWTFQLLDRSLVFVGGGLLLLVLSGVLERKRRALLAGLNEPVPPEPLA